MQDFKKKSNQTQTQAVSDYDPLPFFSTILPTFSNYFCLPLCICPPLPLVQEEKVSSGEASGDLWGLLSVSQLRLSPRHPAGLPEILWLPRSTPETGCDSPVLNRKWSVSQMQNHHYCLGMNARSFTPHITTFYIIYVVGFVASSGCEMNPRRKHFFFYEHRGILCASQPIITYKFMAHFLCNLRITFIHYYQTFAAFVSFMWYARIKCFAHYPLTVSYSIHLFIQASTAVSDYFHCF